MPTAELAAQRTSRALKLSVHVSVREVFDLAVGALAKRLCAGDLTPRQFEGAMRELVAEVHVASYAAGRSGLWQDIGPAEWRRVEAVIARQYSFLRGFRDWLVETPEDEATEARVRQRSRLYGAASRQSFERGALAEVGLTLELPGYPGDGTTDCRANCRCRWAVRVLSKARGDYDVSWRLGSAEHCRQCRQRSRSWKGLRVRRHVLESGYPVAGCYR